MCTSNAPNDPRDTLAQPCCLKARGDYRAARLPHHISSVRLFDEDGKITADDVPKLL